MAAAAETFPSGGSSPPLDVFLPTSPGKVPAALILHGGFDMLPLYGTDIMSFGKALAVKGIAAALPREGRGHGFTGAALPESRDRTVAFFNAILRGP